MKFSQIKDKLVSAKKVLTNLQKTKIKGGNDTGSIPPDTTDGIITVDTVDV